MPCEGAYPQVSQPPFLFILHHKCEMLVIYISIKVHGTHVGMNSKCVRIRRTENKTGSNQIHYIGECSRNDELEVAQEISLPDCWAEIFTQKWPILSDVET